MDNVKIRCAQCGNENVTRLKDVGNPWLDASIVPFSTMGYFSDRAYWQEWFPADFIVECLPGQFRNWFYALLAISTMMEECAPFKTLLGHGLVMDDNMEEMHKSKGNAIDFNEAADKIGVDVMRWLYCAHAPERNLAFGPAHADETRKRILIPLWNVYSFFSNYARLDGFDPNEPRIPIEQRSDLDRWIVSDLQLLIKTAHAALTDFNTLTLCQEAERFIENLSTWYVRRSRRRFWKSEWSDDKRAAYQTLYEVLTTFNQIVSPILVFCTERMYRNMVANQVSDAPPSIHLCDYPRADDGLIDTGLSDRMAAFMRVVARPLIFRCGGLAQIVYQCRKAHTHVVGERRGGVQRQQGMHAGVHFGVMGRGLGNPVQRVDLRHQAAQGATGAQYSKTLRWAAFAQRALQFRPHPLGDQRIHLAVGDHPLHQVAGGVGDAKPQGRQARREARDAQDAHRVLGKGRGHMAEHSIAQILRAAEGIDQCAGRGLGHGVDGQIAALQVLLKGHVRRGMQDKTVIARSGLALGARQRIFLVALRMEEHRKIPTHLFEAAPAHVFGCGAHHHPVTIRHRQAEALVAYRPAHQIHFQTLFGFLRHRARNYPTCSLVGHQRGAAVRL